MTYDITLADVQGMLSATNAGSMMWHWVPQDGERKLPSYAGSTDLSAWAESKGDSVILDSTVGEWDIRLEKDVEYNGSKARFTLYMHAGTARRCRELSPCVLMRTKRRDAKVEEALDELFLLALSKSRRWSNSLLPTETNLVDGFHKALAPPQPN